MKKITTKLSCALMIMCLFFSCKNSPEAYKNEAHTKVNDILVQALTDVSDSFNSEPYIEFHQMDTIQFDSIFNQLTSETAAVLYQSDMALYTTEECVLSPSAIQDAKEKEIAISDSIYYSILTDKLKELRGEKKMDDFSHFEHLVYQKRVHMVSLEMARFCSPERFESFKNWRERIKSR